MKTTTILAGFYGCPKKEYKAVVIYDTTDKELLAMGGTKSAFVEYDDTLIEAFYYPEEDGWELDDIGIRDVFAIVEENPVFPNMDKLEGTDWEMVVVPGRTPDEHFWEPRKREIA